MTWASPTRLEMNRKRTAAITRRATDYRNRFEPQRYKEDNSCYAPADVERRYEGQWIAWDTDANQVIASGDSMKQVIDRAKAHVDNTGHLMWYHHVVRKDAVVVGGIW